MSEVRLIDANALAESDMAKLIDEYLYNQCNLTVGFAAALMPEIEAEPVKHGRWIQSDALDYKDPNGVIHVHGMCSCCKLIYDFRDMTSRFKFCPNCGAKMELRTPTEAALDMVDSVMMGDASIGSACTTWTSVEAVTHWMPLPKTPEKLQDRDNSDSQNG